MSRRLRWLNTEGTAELEAALAKGLRNERRR